MLFVFSYKIIQFSCCKTEKTLYRKVLSKIFGKKLLVCQPLICLVNLNMIPQCDPSWLVLKDEGVHNSLTQNLYVRVVPFNISDDLITISIRACFMLSSKNFNIYFSTNLFQIVETNLKCNKSITLSKLKLREPSET